MIKFFKNPLRTIRAIILTIISLLLIGILTGALYLKSEKGKKWLTVKTQEILSDALETGVSLDSARLDMPRGVTLHGLTVCDHRNNTILNSKTLGVKFTIYSFDRQSLVISKIRLEDPHFYGRKYRNDTAFNYDYIIENTRSDNRSPEHERMFRVLLDDVQIKDGHFQLYNYTNEALADGHQRIDFDRLKLNNLNLRASYFQFVRGRISADINHLSFQESSGFQIDTFKTAFAFHENRLDFQNLLLKTPYSRIADQVTMKLDQKSDLQNFVDEVELITHFEASNLAFRDLAYFAEDISPSNQEIQFSGNVRGKVKDFESQNFRLAFGKSTFFKGAISFNGLPNFDQTFIKLKCNRSQLQIADFKQFFPEMELPLNLEKIRKARFQGNFTGFPSDFVAFGNFQTPLGKIQTDLNLKQPGNLKKASYSGKLKLENFNIGKLVGEATKLGAISMEGKVKGEGLALEHLNMNMDAGVQSLVFNDYTYNQIRVSGDFSDERFKGKLSVNDPEVGLDFQGAVDFSKKKPAFDFTADLRNADLYHLNFVQDTMVVDSRVKLDFKASNANNAEGQVNLTKTSIQLSDRKLSFDSLGLRSKIQERSEKTDHKRLELASDIMDLSLAGKYNITSLDDVAKMTLSRFIDRELMPGDTFKQVNEEFNFDLHINNAAFLMELAKTPLVLQDDTKISGYVNTRTKDLTVKAEIPGFYYRDWRGRGITVKGSGGQEYVYLKSRITELKRKDSTLIEHSWVSAEKSKGDSLRLRANLNQDQKEIELSTALRVRKNSVSVDVYDSRFHLRDTAWQIRARPITYQYDSIVTVPQFSFINAQQRLTVSGEIGGPEAQPLRLVFDNMRLGIITKDLFPQFSPFQGTANGQFMVHSLKTEPRFKGGIVISELQMNADTLGNMRLSATYKPKDQQIALNASVTEQNLEPVINLQGRITLKDKNQINLVANFEQTRLSLFEGFFDEYVSDLSGSFQSKVLIQGTLSEPDILGYFDLNNAALTVDYLQTRYQLDDRIAFNQNKIQLNNLRLKDERNQVATVKGQINHKHFKDLKADIKLSAKNFKALNTTKADNDVFYGTAYGSGVVNFSGPLSDITIDMTMRSEKGTVINLPAFGDSDYEGYDFIHYTDDQLYYNEEFQVNTGGVNLDMELELTTDALVRIIFDPETQDILKGHGTGNLQLNLTKAGSFDMYGNYTVKQGDYLFTAMDVIRKRFELKKGGTIKWTGDPLDAEMDIQAAYKVKTSTAPLLPPDAGQDQASQNDVPVEAQLFLTGSLFSPTIDLNFEILEKGNTGSSNVSTLSSQIQRIKNNEQALNQQVVSLLVMNRFIRSSGFQASEALGASSNSLVGDLISNQLTYWVRQFSDEIKYLEDVQLGIDYQGRTTAQNGEVNQQQMEVALSTSLFNDRVAISGSMDMQSSSGNVEVTYKLTKEGRVQVKVFSRTNNNPVLNRNTQKHGTGIIWQKSFDTWSEFFGGQSDKKSSPVQKDTTKESKPTDSVQLEPSSFNNKGGKPKRAPDSRPALPLKGPLPPSFYNNPKPR